MIVRSHYVPRRPKQRRTPARQQLGAFGGDWENWCDNGGAERDYDGRGSICRREFLGGGLVPFAPWTVGGKWARLIAAWGIPNPIEFDPENLASLPFRDPLRFAWLCAASVPASVFAVGAPSLYMASFQPPSPAGILLAIGVATARGGTARAWEKVIKPVADANVALALSMLSYGPFRGGFMYYARQQSEVPYYPEPVRAVLRYLSESGDLFEAFTKPARFREKSTIEQIGVGIRGMSQAVGFAQGMQLGDALALFAEPVSLMLSGAPPAQIGNACIQQVTGVDPIGVAQLADGWRDASIKTLARTQQAKYPNAIQLLAGLPNVFESIASAVQKIKLPGDLTGHLARAIQSFAGSIGGQLGHVQDVQAAATAPTPAEAARGSYAPLPLPGQYSPGQPVPVAPASDARPLLFGATAGMLTGGPPGALIGGALAALIGRKR